MGREPSPQHWIHGAVLVRLTFDMVRAILLLLLMSFTPDPGSTLPTTSLASTAHTGYIRDSTFGKQLVSMYNAAKSKRAFTSFRFRNRKNRRVIGKFEQKRWMHVPLPPRLMPLNLLGPEALQELTTLKGGYNPASKM